MLPGRLRRWLCAAGTRRDRLHDPDAVVGLLDLRPGMVVADLGPGAGHFTLRMTRAVEPDGIVYALDVNERTLDELRDDAEERGITTLRPVSAAIAWRSRSRRTCCSFPPPTITCRTRRATSPRRDRSSTPALALRSSSLVRRESWPDGSRPTRRIPARCSVT
jgi:hypothetical protein